MSKVGILLSGVLVLLTACGIRTTPDDLPLIRIEFVDEIGYLIGGRSFRTVDGGKTWTRATELNFSSTVEFDPLYLSRLASFRSHALAFHVIDGRFNHSRDGGGTWTSIESGFRLHGISFLNESTGFALSNSGVLRTRDGGLNWTVSTPLGFDAVEFMTTNEVFAIGGSRLYYSPDQGETWEIRRALPTYLWGLKVFDQKLWMVGEGGFCAALDPMQDDLLDCNLPGKVELHDIAVQGEVKIAVGRGPHIFVSLAKGQWQSYRVGNAGSRLASVAFAPDGTAFVVGGVPTAEFYADWKGPARIALKSRDYINWVSVELPR